MNTNPIARRLIEKKKRAGSIPRFISWNHIFPKNLSAGNFITRRYIYKRFVWLCKPIIPNQETIEAMEAIERGEVKSFNSIDDLFADLNADD